MFDFLFKGESIVILVSDKKNFMEKEERRVKCLPVIPRKKVLFAFVVINIVFWVFYYSDCHLKHEGNSNYLKPVFSPIYNIPLFHIPLLGKEDMSMFYIEIKPGIWCFYNGVNVTESKRLSKCECSRNWYGLDCGIPAAVWKSSLLQDSETSLIEIRRRKKPRRVIVLFAVDGNMELLDVNIQNAFSAVDLFLTIQEKDNIPSILKLFKQGYLIEYQSKIIPFQLDKHILNLKENNWSEIILNELWGVIWNRLADFRPDDIFLFSHVSSIISNDVLLFLKLYDGFPEPFFFELRPLLFKFWRELTSNNTNSELVPFKPVGCTFQFIASICEFEIMNFFANTCSNDQHKIKFEKNFWPLKVWFIGNSNTPSGWQCNFCCKNECIKESLRRQSHLKNDTVALPLNFSRANPSVIKDIVDKYSLFNSKNLFFKIVSKNDNFFAPPSVIQNPLYSHMID